MIYSTSWWFSTILCIQIKLLTKWFILFWLERRWNCPIPKLRNWNNLIWKWDNFFVPDPMRFIQLPGDSPPLYVSKSSFSQSDSSLFDWNNDEAVLFPNWETGITWFESGITSSCQLLWDLFNFLVILHHFMYPNQASYKVIHPGLIGMTKKLCYSQTGKLESPNLKVA